MGLSKHGLFFTDHALVTMRDRGVSMRDLRNALRNQLDEYPGTHELEGTIVIVGTSMLGRQIHVVVEEKDRTRIVSTRPEQYRRFRGPRRRRGSHRRQR